MLDIFFTYDYAKLYEKIEKGTCEIINFSCSYGEIRYVFIKRKISYKIDNVEYFDIVTPYGYGGPVILESIDREKLVAAYNEQFANFCIENRIVSEFVRFHPLLNNQSDFHKLFEVLFNRHTVAVDLTSKDIFMSELSSKCRNTIRKSNKKGVKVRLDYNGKTIETFYKLYVITMEKNKALDYYYFPLEYFQQLTKSLINNYIILNAYLEDEIISSAIFLYSDKYMYYHLAASNPSYYKFAAGNAVLWDAISWGSENNLQKLHLGGGYSTSDNDSLYKYKKGFSNDKNYNFYIGKRIHNQNIYTKLVEIRSQHLYFDVNTLYFPAYRG